MAERPDLRLAQFARDEGALRWLEHANRDIGITPQKVLREVGGDQLDLVLGSTRRSSETMEAA